MGAMLDSLATSCHEAWVLFIIDSKCWPTSPTVEGENGQVCYYNLTLILFLLKRRLKVFAENVFVGSTYLTSSYRKSIVCIF